MPNSRSLAANFAAFCFSCWTWLSASKTRFSACCAASAGVGTNSPSGVKYVWNLQRSKSLILDETK